MFRVKFINYQRLLPKHGGEAGIRTLGTGKGTPALQAGALNHYATSPLKSYKNSFRAENILLLRLKFSVRQE